MILRNTSQLSSKPPPYTANCSGFGLFISDYRTSSWWDLITLFFHSGYKYTNVQTLDIDIKTVYVCNTVVTSFFSEKDSALQSCEQKKLWTQRKHSCNADYKSIAALLACLTMLVLPESIYTL